MSGAKQPAYREILHEIAASLDGPIPFDELVARMLERKPSRAQNPKQTIRDVVRMDLGDTLVFLDANTLLPTRLAMKGARFRLPLSLPSVPQGHLPADYLEPYLPLRFPPGQIRFVTSSGQPLTFTWKSLQRTVHTIFGPTPVVSQVLDLRPWLQKQKAGQKDHLILTIQDWTQGVLQIELEPYNRVDFALLDERDRALADLIYLFLEEATREEIWVREAVARAYALLPDKAGYPPHHLFIVLEKDGRFRFDDVRITYADRPLGLFDAIWEDESGPRIPLQPVTAEQARVVYRFEVVSVYNPRNRHWVEIQGGQTLDDLNRLLVGLFGYDPDHLAGFWKRVPRKGRQKTRYRDVEIGTVDPFGEGSAAEIHIAALGLKEGDQLRYVFDFGDYHDHILTLEAVTLPEEGVRYPREVPRK